MLVGHYCPVRWIPLIVAWTKDVAIGSAITIRHVNTQGGNLHSHAHVYPGGSGRASSPLNFLLLKAHVDEHRTTDHPVSSR